jgi:BirA family biotin operon repressor/biotin-[acetyl-CoA-carboxylase] ligase
MASVAVAEAIKDETPLPVTLKWPNDVMLQDKKVAGILAEMVAETDCLHFVVCGIGINVNISRESFPEELSLTATSLKIELGREVSRLEFLRRVLRGLDRYYGLLLRQGSGVILEAWQRLPNMLGKKVRVVTPGETLIGEARELDSEGALLLQGAEGSLRRIVAGDVHLLRDEETLESIPC